MTETAKKLWRRRGSCPDALKNTAQPWRDNRDCDFAHRYSRMPTPDSLCPGNHLSHDYATGDALAAIILDYWRPEYALRNLIRVEDSSVIDDPSRRFDGTSVSAGEGMEQ